MQRTVGILAAVLIGLLSAPSAVAQETFEGKAVTPAGRHGAAMVAWQGKLILIGGYDGTGSRTDACHAYNPATDAWTTFASFPATVSEASATVSYGDIFVAGGRTDADAAVASFYVFNAAANRWDAKGSLLEPRRNFGLTSVGIFLYAFGGVNASGLLATVEQFDPGMNSWSLRTTMEQAVEGVAVGSIENRIVVAGGLSDGGAVVTARRFDPGVPAPLAWSTLEDLPVAVHSSAFTTIGRRLFLLGGIIDGLPTDKTIEFADQWYVRAPVPAAITGAVASMLDGHVHLVGSDQDPGLHLEYTPQPVGSLPGIVGLAQRNIIDWDLPPGAITGAGLIKFLGNVVDNDGGPVTFEVEARLLGDDYRNLGIVGAAAAPGVHLISFNLGDGVYAWRARAIDPDQQYSAWIDFGSNAANAADLTVDGTAPSLPIQLTNDGTEFEDQFVELDWTDASDPAGGIVYVLEIAADDQFTEALEIVSSVSHRNIKLSKNSTYFWRVAAEDRFNNISAWTATYRFETGDGPSINDHKTLLSCSASAPGSWSILFVIAALAAMAASKR